MSYMGSRHRVEGRADSRAGVPTHKVLRHSRCPAAFWGSASPPAAAEPKIHYNTLDNDPPKISQLEGPFWVLENPQTAAERSRVL